MAKEDGFSAVVQYQHPAKGAYIVGLAAWPSRRRAPAEFLAASVQGVGAGAGGAASSSSSSSSSIEVLALTEADVRRSSSLRAPHAGGAPAADLAFLSGGCDGGQGRCLITCGEDGAVKLWDLRSSSSSGPQRLLRSAPAGVATAKDDPSVPSVSVSEDDRLCAFACGSMLHVLDIGSGKPLFMHEEAHSEPVMCVRFRPSSASSSESGSGGLSLPELVSAGDDGLLCALDVGRCAEGGKAVEEDAGLRIVMNGGESVRRLSFLGEDASVAATVSTTEVLQLWSLHGDRPGASCGRFDDLRGGPLLRVGETDGYVVDALYDQASGRAHIVAGAVDGSLALFHLNLEEASLAHSLPSASAAASSSALARGHRAVVRAVEPLLGLFGGCAGGFATAGEDGRVCIWRPGAGGDASRVGAQGRTGKKRGSKGPWWQVRNEKKRARWQAANAGEEAPG